MAQNKRGQRPSKGADNRRAAMWLLASAVLFTLTSILVKYLGAALHPLQISFFRALVALMVILPIFARSGGLIEGMKTKIPALQVFRGVIGSTAMILGFYAIVHLPLADAQAIGFSRNLFVVPLAALILAEFVGPRRALATLVGFAGVLIMLRPGGGMMMSAGALAALGHAALVAVASILVSIASRHDKPTTLMFYTNVVAIVMVAVPAAFVWQMPSLTQFTLLFVMGILATSAHNCFIRAYGMGEASAIAPVDYSRLVLAAIAGFFLFGDIPDSYTIIGALIIVGASFYIIRYEARATPPNPN